MSYREAVQSARAQGRSALDTAQDRWAAPLGIAPADGVVLSELRTGHKTIADITRNLEACGAHASEIKAAIDRLAGAGLIEPIPTASHAS